MSNQKTRNFPSATCQHCGKVTNISLSHCYRQLVSKNKTLSELNKTLLNNLHKWMNIKNGQIQAMHLTISRLILLLNDNQKVKAKKISQEMREAIKKAEKVKQ